MGLAGRVSADDEPNAQFTKRLLTIRGDRWFPLVTGLLLVVAHLLGGANGYSTPALIAGVAASSYMPDIWTEGLGAQVQVGVQKLVPVVALLDAMTRLAIAGVTHPSLIGLLAYCIGTLALALLAAWVSTKWIVGGLAVSHAK